MSGCAAVAKRKWPKREQPHSQRAAFLTSFVSCPPVKFSSMSKEKIRHRSGADRAYSKFLDCPRKSSRHCQNLRTRKLSPSGKKICELVCAKPPTPNRRTTPVICF